MTIERNRKHGGFSLPEMLVTIAIIGVLASLAIVAMSGVSEGAQLAMARQTLEKLNAGLKSFNQTNWDIRTVSNDASTADEYLVLRSLQYRLPSRTGRFDVSAPCYPPTWNPVPSSSPQEYRILWNGVCFKLIEKGMTGTGLKVVFDSTDQARKPYEFPSNYKPEGAK